MSRLAVHWKLGIFVMLVLAAPMTGAAMADDPAESCFGQPATIVGDERDQLIVGTDGPDVIVGLGGNDRIEGKGGDDLICGGDGNDHLIGWAGDDQLDGGAGTDELKGNNGSDTIHGGPDGDNIAGGFDENNADNTLYGDDGDDFIKGHRGEDLIWGGDGDDSVMGGTRDDEVHGGPGDDDLDGGDERGASGVDAVFGDDGDDHVRGDSRDRQGVVIGGNGDDVVEGRRGGHLEGGDGNDTLYATNPEGGTGGGAKPGATLLGGAGDDVLHGRYSPSLLDGGPHVVGDVCDPGTKDRPNTLVDCEQLLTDKEADLSVSIAPDSSVAHVGVPITFSVTFGNAGPATPKTSLWRFRVRGAATFDDNGTLHKLGTRTLTFTVTPVETGALSALAKVGTTRVDPDTSNNTSSVTIFVES